MKPRTVIAFLVSVVAAACANPLAVNPRDVYRASFEWPPVADVTDLRGGGLSWRNDEVWIRFSGTPLVRLRAHASFTEADPRSCAEPFLRVLPEEKDVLGDVEHLKCLSFAGRGVTPEGRVLLMNDQRQVYYFRTFKRP